MDICLTRAAHWTPLARTASMTESTRFNRFRWFALRVTDSFHGVFLCISISNAMCVYVKTTYQRRPLKETWEALNAPIIVEEVLKVLRASIVGKRQDLDNVSCSLPCCLLVNILHTTSTSLHNERRRRRDGHGEWCCQRACREWRREDEREHRDAFEVRNWAHSPSPRHQM